MKILYISGEYSSRDKIQKDIGLDDEVIQAEGALEGISLTGIRDFDFVLINSNLRNYDSRVIADNINPEIPKGFYRDGLGIVDTLDMPIRKAVRRGFREVIMRVILNWPVLV